MAHGWTSVPTGAAGIREMWQRAGNLTPWVPGNGPTPVGIGTAMNHGPGPVITMDHGMMIRGSDGFGYLPRIGPLPGSPGDPATTTSDGLRAARDARFWPRHSSRSAMFIISAIISTAVI
jgi:hypothetical protein